MPKFITKIGNVIKIYFFGRSRRVHQDSQGNKQPILEAILDKNEKVLAKLEYCNKRTSDILRKIELSKHAYHNKKMALQDLEKVLYDAVDELKSLNLQISGNQTEQSNVVYIKDHKDAIDPKVRDQTHP